MDGRAVVFVAADGGRVLTMTDHARNQIDRLSEVLARRWESVHAEIGRVKPMADDPAVTAEEMQAALKSARRGLAGAAEAQLALYALERSWQADAMASLHRKSASLAVAIVTAKWEAAAAMKDEALAALDPRVEELENVAAELAEFVARLQERGAAAEAARAAAERGLRDVIESTAAQD